MTASLPLLAPFFQTLPPLLMLAFAALSLGVARRTPPPLAAERHRAAWRLTGAAFLVIGTHALVVAAASWAGAAPGAGESAHAPVLLVYALVMLLLAARRGTRVRRGGRIVRGALVLALVPGATSRWWLPELSPSPAAAGMAAAVLEAATVVLLLAALLAALLRDAVDQLLWGALALFALRAAVGAWLPLLSGVPGRSAAAPVLTTLALAAMVALAARRLALARRGARVPSLVEPLWSRPVGTAR